MPIALESGKRWPVVLDSDKGMKPEPTFFVRALSMREQYEVADVIDSEKKGKTARQIFDEVLDCLKLHVIGWENMVDENTGEIIQFDLDQLNRLIDYVQARELLSKIMINGHVSHEEKKG